MRASLYEDFTRTPACPADCRLLSVYVAGWAQAMRCGQKLDRSQHTRENLNPEMFMVVFSGQEKLRRSRIQAWYTKRVT